MLDPVSGQWVDDEFDPAKPNGGDVGAQTDAPVIPMPPGPSMHYVQTDPTVITAGPDAGTDVLPQAPPGLPQPAPYMPQAMPPIPPGRVVSPAESQNLSAIDANTAARMASAQDAGALGDAGAQAKLQAANRDAYATEGLDADKARSADEFAKRVAEREQQAQADYQKYKSFGIKDPEADDSFATRILKAVVIGMGQYASGMNGGQNTALHIIQSANEENIARQKAQQEKLLAVAERSGKDVEATKKERDDAFRQLDLKHAAMLESSAGMLRQELARIGVPEAQIDANEAVQKVEKDALAIRERTLQGIRDDETTLARADIAAAAKKKKGGGGAGGGQAMAKFAEMAGALRPGDSIPPDLVVLGAKAGLKPNQIAAEVDRYRMSADKAASMDAKANGAGAGGIGSVRQNAVLGNLAEAEKAAKDVGGVSIDSIRKLQTNEEQSRSAEHSAQSGVFGNLLTRAGRATGLVARGRYDGIPEDQQKKITAAEQVITHLTEMQQGKNIETLEQYRERYSPYVPGLSEAEVRRREKALPGLVAEQRGIQDPKGVGRQRQAAVEDPRIQQARDVLADPARLNRLNTAQKAYLLKVVRDSRKPAPGNGGDPTDDITL